MSLKSISAIWQNDTVQNKNDSDNNGDFTVILFDDCFST